MNPWHDVEIGENAPENVNTIVEIPRGSRNKYELDKKTGLLKLDRVLFSSMFYPHNYGFIPRTLGDDHDPLDILVLSALEVVPMCLVEARVIGVMLMQDEGDMDEKIIAVAAHDISVNHINDISELPEHFSRELRTFFEDYKKLEHKEVVVEEFQSKEKAMEIIQHCQENYQKEYGA